MANHMKKGRSTKRRTQTGRGKLPYRCVISKTKEVSKSQLAALPRQQMSWSEEDG